MGVEELDEPPIPAIEDAGGKVHDLDDFLENYRGREINVNKQVAQVLCAEFGTKSPQELVLQPSPSLGPAYFIIESDKFRFLSNFEDLILKAVESNSGAAFVFLMKFASHDFIQMDFYETILDQAIKTDRVGSLVEDYLPNANSNWERNYTEKINKLKVMKRLIEKNIETENWAFLRTIPKDKKYAAGQFPEKLVAALKKLIEHNQFLLEKLREIFAK